MFFRKCEKNGHPYIVLIVGALAAIGVLTVKQCGMEYIKQKWKKISRSMKNMPMPTCDGSME